MKSYNGDIIHQHNVLRMRIKSIRTHKITSKDKDITKVLDRYIPKLKEKSVVAIASKIVSICEGRVVKIGSIDKDELIAQEAQYFLPRKANKWHVSLTIAKDTLVATAGIDESNGNGYYILWPKDPQKSANKIREYLVKRFTLKKVGVIITDSKTTPLRWGTTGFVLAHSGFQAIRDYIGKPDVFGRKLEYTKLNIADSLASAAVLAMGEGNEQTPITVVEDPVNVVFQDRNPSAKELADLRVTIDEDLYGPFLKGVAWHKGKK